MSTQALHYVFQGSPVKRAARLVLLSLANHANGHFESWPAVRTMVREAKMDRRNVQANLRKLEACGEIEVVGNYSRGGRRTTTYYLAKCREWVETVDAPTRETPYGNRRDDVGLAHENEQNRTKYPYEQRTSAAPAAYQRRPSSVPAPPVERREQAGDAYQRRSENTSSAAPVAWERRPSSVPAPPNPSFNRSITPNSKPGAAFGRAEAAPAGYEKELQDRRKVEARDRRERLEALLSRQTSEARVGQGPDGGVEQDEGLQDEELKAYWEEFPDMRPQIEKLWQKRA